MTDLDTIRRADLALTNLNADGGLLNPEQNDQFIRTLLDQPTILREMRTITMNAPTMNINKINFGSRILFPARVTGSQEDAGSNLRHPLAAERSAPTTSQVVLNTSEVIAEVRLNDEILEDNIEQGDLTNTILDLIAERAALDLEELVIQGDTGSGDTYLALQDGILKRATTNIVDAQGQAITADIFNNTLKGLPTRFRRNRNLMRFYSSMDLEQDYRLALSDRGTSLGDAVLTGTTAVPVFGVPLRGTALMPDTTMIFTNPQNLIWGIQRNVRIETDRDIRSREWIVVLTARIAIQIEEEPAVVKVINLG